MLCILTTKLQQNIQLVWLCWIWIILKNNGSWPIRYTTCMHTSPSSNTPTHGTTPATHIHYIHTNMYIPLSVYVYWNQIWKFWRHVLVNHIVQHIVIFALNNTIVAADNHNKDYQGQENVFAPANHCSQPSQLQFRACEMCCRSIVHKKRG